MEAPVIPIKGTVNVILSDPLNPRVTYKIRFTTMSLDLCKAKMDLILTKN